MSGREIYSAGVLRDQWNYNTRLYTSWNQSGAQTAQRPFTAQENAEADTAIAMAQAAANEATLQTNLGGSQVFENLRTIANGTGTFSTATARDAAIRTCARGLVIIIRIMLRRLDALD